MPRNLTLSVTEAQARRVQALEHAQIVLTALVYGNVRPLPPGKPRAAALRASKALLEVLDALSEVKS